MTAINFDALEVASRKFNTQRDVLTILGWIILPFIALTLLSSVIPSEWLLNFASPLLPLLSCVGFAIVIAKSFRRRSAFIATTTDRMRHFAAANGWIYRDDIAGWIKDGAPYVPEGYFEDSSFHAHPQWSIEGAVQGRPFLLASLECSVAPRVGRPHMAFLTVLTLQESSVIRPRSADKGVYIMTTQSGVHITLPYAAARQNEMKKLFATVVDVT